MYFWWGDTTGHRPKGTTFEPNFKNHAFDPFSFSATNSAIYTDGNSVSELQSAGWVTSDGVLAQGHDAAHVKWGGSWRMPTYQELYDLCNNKCNWTWTTTNGVNGYIVCGRDNYASNSIFLPCTGVGNGTSLNFFGSCGCYWSPVPLSDSSYSSYMSYFLSFSSDSRKMTRTGYRRWAGLPIRPVQGIATADSETGSSAWFMVDTTDKPLTLSAELANWAEGSITFCCTNAGTSGAAHTYTLQYYDESNTKWEDVTGNDAAVSLDANGNVHLTDKGFSSRLGGIPPVKYRVKEENSGRVSAECVTRTKYGIVVGLGKWLSSAYKETLANVGGANNAKTFRRLAAELGSFDDGNMKTLVNSGATTNAVSAAFTEVSQKAIVGDICVLYFTTHGGFFGEKGSGLALYNGIYRDTAMASDIAKLDAANKGLAVVVIVDACHSVALYDNPSLGVNETQWYLSNDLAQCSPNVAWVTSASRVEESSYGLFDIFLLDYGWGKGWAGAGDTLTFLELAQYTKSRYDAVFNGIVFDHDRESYFKEVNIENDIILSRVMAGMRGSHGANGEVLSTPQGVVASQGQNYTKIKVSWNPVDEATGYVVFFRIGVGEKCTGCVWGQPLREKCERWLTAEKLEKEYGDKFKSRDENSPVFFAVKAFNGAGVSALSDIAEGWMDYKKLWERMIPWLGDYPSIISASYGDFNVAIKQTAACGTRTVEECYILGIDPEDPNDDLKIADFKMEGDKPVITLNHTEDGSGNSFLPRVKTLGKANLADSAEEWREVPEGGDPAMRFFKVEVEMP